MAGPILDREPRAGVPPETVRIEIRHGTALRWLDRGILLLGPSGAGKSDFALRLIDRGADLVADDLVRIEARVGRLIATAQAAPGLIELRGQGIFRLEALAETALDLALELGPADDRLPAAETIELAGHALPLIRLDPTAASATARLRVLLTAERVY
jgi:serine kinase of HPr protein (carbohydrate metabolism regulator)